MQRRLLTGLAGAFALMTLVLLVGGLLSNPALLILAVLFGTVTYILYAHATGRLLTRIYRRVERRAAARTRSNSNAGPKREWRPPRNGQRRRARQQRGRDNRRRHPRNSNRAPASLSDREAAGILGVEPGADERTVTRAYRERIKDVHPDTEGGDEDEFKRVQAAYERLSQ